MHLNVPLVPGPTATWRDALHALAEEYPPTATHPEYRELLRVVREDLGTILGTRGTVAVLPGNPSLAAWAALKSVLLKDDQVLCVVTGPESAELADMVRAVADNVETLEVEAGRPADPAAVASAVTDSRPKLVTLAHCESQWGLLNPAEEICRAAKAAGAELVCLDVSASAGGVPLASDEWGVDLCIAAADRCLSAPSLVGIAAVSDAAWQAAEQARYEGYDALLPWQRSADRLAEGAQISAPAWPALASLAAACRSVLDDGLSVFQRRHSDVAGYTRERLRGLGLKALVDLPSAMSPTVTAARLPASVSWHSLDISLRAEGVWMGGGWTGAGSDIVQIGHMGSQAELANVKRGIDILAELLYEPAGIGV